MKKVLLSVSIALSTTLFLSFFIIKNNLRINEKQAEKMEYLYNPSLFDVQNLILAKSCMKLDDSIIVLKNKPNYLPIGNLNKKISAISFGGSSNAFHDGIFLFCNAETTQNKSLKDFTDSSLRNLKESDLCIISLHAPGTDESNNTINAEHLTILDKLSTSQIKILILFGDEKILTHVDPKKADVIIWVEENSELSQNKVAQLLFGAVAACGHLQKSIGKFDAGDGITTQTNGRLRFGVPSDLGIEPKTLDKIDELALQGIEDGAYPGCQILVSVKGNIIYRKSFGLQTKNGNKVTNNDLYDIASITKIAASTLLTMHLVDKGLLDIDKKLGDYIPKTTGSGPYSQINIREMLAHQAGLVSWIRFYSKTLKDGALKTELYSHEKKTGFDLMVAEGIYMKNDYVDSMYKHIINTPLGVKKYKYSDLCFYFIQKINEKIVQKKQNDYLLANIYLPMGLRYLRYKPLDYFPKIQITPTENDKTFRKQLIHGYVHDPGAAMLGGVAGHAGLFSNATDLASIMQLFLQKGKYAGANYFSEKIIDDFTRAQFSGNKRGAGFDRPNAGGGGTCDELASARSFGHSGFTGALAWADPKDEIIFIFLSNRVNPDAENWKLRDMEIRTKIQHVVYQAVNTRKK